MFDMFCPHTTNHEPNNVVRGSKAPVFRDFIVTVCCFESSFIYSGEVVFAWNKMKAKRSMSLSLRLGLDLTLYIKGMLFFSQHYLNFLAV